MISRWYHEQSDDSIKLPLKRRPSGLIARRPSVSSLYYVMLEHRVAWTISHFYSRIIIYSEFYIFRFSEQFLSLSLCRQTHNWYPKIIMNCLQARTRQAAVGSGRRYPIDWHSVVHITLLQHLAAAWQEHSRAVRRARRRNYERNIYDECLGDIVKIEYVA